MLPTTPTDLHFRPPLDRVGELEWNTFDGILQQVRDPAKQVLAVDFCTRSEAGSLLDASSHLYRHRDAACGPQPQGPDDLRGHRWFAARRDGLAA